ncbi:hypothetical protein ACIBG8_19170 [Nonomuraea sp. NPDC050556]|uniref:hypothetical protein n=1 Tax=Nonomuraea sp. NPDC050556 TaxID=3364369 RepID=UPI0037BB7DA6
MGRGEDVTLATAGELPPPGVLVAALDAADLDTVVVESTPRRARFLVGEPVTWQRCELSILRESLRRPAVACGDLLVVGLDDAVGLKMRSLHDRGLAEDVMGVASVAHLYSYRELETLGQGHHEGFSVHELLTRLEFVDSMDVGVEVRRFAGAWVEDIKLRRAEEGDVDYDDPDLPHID